MSALPPKADIDWSLLHVRFVPIADMGQRLRLHNVVLDMCELSHTWVGLSGS
jgi:hypothetical protein